MRKKKVDKIRGIDTTPKENKPQDSRFKGQEKRSTKYEVRGMGKSEVRSEKSGVKNQETSNPTPDSKLHPANGGTNSDLMPLNKFIAHAGVCGRREAAELVKEGKVTVNGDKIFEPGYKVTGSAKVSVKGKPVFLQKNSVYILLNKPKDFLTTSNDPQGRKTVLDLIKHATQERVYPIGRLG